MRISFPSIMKIGVLLLCSFGLIFSAEIGAAAGTVYFVNGNVSEALSSSLDDDCKTIETYSNSYRRYTDYANGFRLLFPAWMAVDNSLSAVCTVFGDDKTRIEVYYDDFRGTASNTHNYISYGNKFVVDSAAHYIQTDRWFYSAGHRVHLLEWSRRKLARVPGDKNYYSCAEIIKNDFEVYTVFIKSSQPVTWAMDVISNFTFFDRRGIARNYPKHMPSATRMNSETQSLFQKYLADSSPLSWGIFEPSAPQSLFDLKELETRLDFQFPFLLHYQMMDEHFPVWGLNQAYDNNRVVELTLQTVFSGTANALWAENNRNITMVYDILDGKYDDFFKSYAEYLKEFGHPVLFRLDNEMNGDWCWYSGFYTGKDPELYKLLWRYIHDIFERIGVENVIWVWNPHDISRPPFKWNHYLMYYPGDTYVDVVGMTGYNNGTYFPGEKWREFREIYLPLYSDYESAFDKPLIITEFASNSVGGDKPAWIQQMFAEIKPLKKIKIAIWWSGVDFDQKGNPARIYRINQSDAVLDAFCRGLKEYKK